MSFTEQKCLKNLGRRIFVLKIFAQVWAAFFSAKILKNFNVSSFFSSKKGSPKEFCVF